MEYYQIAIDGPSGSGKSTLAKGVASRLGILYLDTGAMYRACGLKAIKTKIDTKDADQVEKMMQDIKIDINDHRLTIHAERHANAEHKDEKTGYIRQERTFGSFSRSFDINEIDESAISAAYVDGVLKLTLPKLQKPLPASHQIEIQ